jgi:hypothetical protein
MRSHAIIINTDFDWMADADIFRYLISRLDLITQRPRRTYEQRHHPVTTAGRLARTITPAATPAPVIDEAAIAARDGRMIDTLTTQSIASIIGRGLENDGETTSSERQAAQDFYESRGHAPLFLTAGSLNARGEALLDLFQTADDYGLNPVDFENPAFIDAGAKAPDAMAAARAEIGMTLWACVMPATP